MKMDGDSIFTTIARVVDLDGPTRNRESIEATHLRSPDQHKEFMPGLMDGGEVNFSVQFDPRDASHDAATGLEAAYYEIKNATWRILPPIPGTTGRWGYEFLGHLTKMGQKYPVNGLVTQDVSIKLSGPATLDDYEFTDDDSV
jgi:hypothetical protein